MVRVSKRENDAKDEDEDVVHGPPRCCELTERAANRLLSSQSCSSSTRPPTGGARALVCCRQILVLSTPKTDSFRIVIPIPSCRKSIDLFLNTTLLLLFFNFFSTFDYCGLEAMSSIEEQGKKILNFENCIQERKRGTYWFVFRSSGSSTDANHTSASIHS